MQAAGRPLSLDEAGALSPQDVIGRDMGALVERLSPWLAAKGFPGARVEHPSYPVGAGQSNETILFTLSDATGRRDPLVLRIAPKGYQLFLDAGFGKQIRLLQTLARGRHVRVPEILWEEADADLVGAHFFIMRQLQGWVPVSRPPYNAAGRLFDAHPRQRERLWQNALLELTRLAAVPAGEIEFLRRGRGHGLDDLLDHEVEAFRWSGRGRAHVPVLEEALEWLLANRPQDPIEGLSWGDARIGNMMFDDAFNLLGVFDWEQASLAGPMMDLGWWLFFDVLYSRMIGLERLPGLGGRDDTIAAWEGLTGLRAADLHWYEYFAGFRLATIFLRKTTLESFSAPTANISNNMFTRLMAEIRGIAPPPDLIETFNGAGRTA